MFSSLTQFTTTCPYVALKTYHVIFPPLLVVKQYLHSLIDRIYNPEKPRFNIKVKLNFVCKDRKDCWSFTKLRSNCAMHFYKRTVGFVPNLLRHWWRCFRANIESNTSLVFKCTVHMGMREYLDRLKNV